MCMVSQDKLIKDGIRYTDKLFDEISRRLEKGVLDSDTLEEFLRKTKEYTTNNPLVSTDYDKTMINIILAETNNHKFSRPAQKELVRVTIENKVGDLIRDVGEDIKQSVRDIVTEEYNNPEGSNPQKMAKQISKKVSGIKNKRAKTIARTEIARTATISDYIIASERGATHYTVTCRSTRCPICKKMYCKSSETGGDVEYEITDTSNLPPVHPNCYMPDTKVFTSKGWKYFKDISEDDKILSLNPLTEEIEFLPYVKLVEVDNGSGLMYHIFNKWFDICITPDHDCFIHQRRDGGEKGRFIEPQFRKPSELSSESRFVRSIDYEKEGPDTVNINGLEFHSADFAFLMAWYISEGSVLHNPETAKAKGYPIKIAQEIQENRDLLKPILERICDYLNIKLYVGKQYFELHSKPLYDYLVQLGYSHEKYIPNEVFGLSKEHLNIFLDNYVLGDGHQRKPNKFNSSERAVFTSSRRLRDDLSLIVLLCGFYPSIYVHNKARNTVIHQNGEYTSTNPVYGIRINNSRYTNFNNCAVEEIFYDGKVYCVELPKYHTLWVMRNGKTSWNGNCRCSANFYKKKGAENTTNEEITTKSSTRPYNLNGGERHSNVEITQGVWDKVIQHQEKRATAKIEWGNTVDLKTGKLNLTEDVKGKKNQVTVPRPSTGNYGLLHNHPSESPFSGGDMFNQLGYRNQNVCVATTPKGVWVARDTEFGAASKVNGLSDNTRYEIKHKMDGKYREFSRETLDKKYAERMRNATTRKEYNAIKKEYLADPEYKEKYAKWVLEEYGVGVNKYNYFEIEFIPKEELKNVRF